MIPKNNFLDYDLKKGDVIYRGTGGIIRANDKTSEFNTFIETKVNEKNKEFMQIWSGLLPEVFDINPKEILILTPQQGKVYGYNSKNKVLASTDIEIDNKEDGPINAILDGHVQNYYWGDLDAQGLQILNQFRSYYPSEIALMMDWATFHTY